MAFNFNRNMRIGLALFSVVFAACNKGTGSGTRNKAMETELLSSSEPSGAEILFDGETVPGAGFYGKITVSAKAKNNTKNSFNRPVGLFVMLKSSAGIVTDGSGTPVGAYLVNRKPWGPGDTALFVSEGDLSAQDGGTFLKLLMGKIDVKYNKPISIDSYVTSGYVVRD